MTDLTDHLDEIEARAEAATPGPWRASLLDGVTYEDGSSSHVAGIYPGSTSGPPPVFVTNSIDRRDAEFIAASRTDVPALLAEVRRLQAAVERVRALHVPFRIYDECECEDTTTPGHVDIEEVGITCNLLYVACRECCTSGVDIRYQTEDCACDHDHRDAYCPTIAALDGDEP